MEKREHTAAEARNLANSYDIVASAKVLKFSDSLKFTRAAIRLRKGAEAAIGAEEEVLRKKLEPIRDEIRSYLEKEDLAGEALEKELSIRLAEHSEAKEILSQIQELWNQKIEVEYTVPEVSAEDIRDDAEPVQVSFGGAAGSYVDPYNVLRNLYTREEVKIVGEE